MQEPHLRLTAPYHMALVKDRRPKWVALKVLLAGVGPKALLFMFAFSWAHHFGDPGKMERRTKTRGPLPVERLQQGSPMFLL